MKKENMNDKGFSLVELIIVIAIMAVLVGVLAPQFIKYVEQSRRSTDIQNAASLQTAYLVDIADGKITSKSTGYGTSETEPAAITDGDSSNLPKTVTEKPTVSASIADKNFYVYANATAGTCQIFVKVGSSYVDLTDSTKAASYKASESGYTE